MTDFASNSVLTRLNYSFLFVAVNWHFTSIQLFLLIPPVMGKTRGVNEPCKWTLFYVENPGIMISFLLFFICFIASFERFLFMMLSVWIENSYIEKCPAHDTKSPSTLASTETLPPIDDSSIVTGCNISSVLTPVTCNINSSTVSQLKLLCFWIKSFNLLSLLDFFCWI